MQTPASLLDRCTDAAVDYLLEEVPGAAATMVDKLLATPGGRATLKRKAEELLGLVVDAQPTLAVERVAGLYVDVEGPTMAWHERLPRHPAGPQALRVALGCDVEAVGIAIDCNDKPSQVFDWFNSFEFPVSEYLSMGDSGLAWHALLTLIAEQDWHVAVREAWEAWVTDWQCVPFRLDGVNGLGDLAIACNHSHGCVLVHWRDLVDLVGGRDAVVQRLTDICLNSGLEDDPYEGVAILRTLKDEIREISGTRRPRTRRGAETAADRGEMCAVKRPWLTIQFS